MGKKAEMYTGTWCHKIYTMGLTDWAKLCDCSRCYFEYRLKAGDDFQAAVDRRARKAGHHAWYLRKPMGRNGAAMDTLCL